MSTSQIDAAILTAAQKSWRKVAMIVARTSSAGSAGVPDDEEGHRLIASRIEALVQEGRLVAQGDIKNWRHSEVRLP